MTSLKKYLLARLIVTVLIGLLIGILLLVIDGNTVLNILFVIFGVILLLDGITSIITSSEKSNYLLISNVISICLGILLICFHGLVVNIIVGIWFIVFPIVNLVLNKNNIKNELKVQLPKLIIGVLILVFGFGSIIEIVLTILGWLIIAISVAYLVLGLVSLSKHE